MNRRLAITAPLLCLLCPMFSDSVLAGTFAKGKVLIRAIYEM